MTNVIDLVARGRSRAARTGPRPDRVGPSLRGAVVGGLRYVGPSVLLTAVLVGGWQWVVGALGIRPQLLPSPSRVVESGLASGDLIMQHAVPTTIAAVLGFLIATAVAFGFALILDFLPAARRAIYPLLIVSQTIPIVAVAPLMVMWFGFGLEPKIILIVVSTFFPMTVSWCEGFNSTERDIASLLQTMGAGRRKIFWYVRLPSALPYFFSGLRIAITYAVVAAIFAEYVGAQYGLGIFMAMQKNAYRTDLVLAAVVVSSMITLGLFAITCLIQRFAIPWYALSKRFADG